MMTTEDQIALDWCRENNASIHYRRRTRDTREVIVETADDTYTAATLHEAVVNIIRRRQRGLGAWHDRTRNWLEVPS